MSVPFAEQRVKPGRVGYLIALAIFLAGAIPSALAFSSGLSGLTEGLIRVIVPGETVVTLDKSGTYTVFHENPSVVDGQTFSSSVPPNALQVSITSEGGDSITMGPAGGTFTYNLSGRSGVSIGSLRVDEPGDYVLAATYSAAGPTEQTVIALGHEKGKATIKTVFGAIGFFASGGIATIIAIVILVLRSRSKSRLQAQALGQG